MSDISYVDEDTLSPTAAAGHFSRINRSNHGGGNGTGLNNLAPRGSTQGMQTSCARQATLVTDHNNTSSTNTSNNTGGGTQYLKVEGSAYRVHRTTTNNQSTSTSLSNQRIKESTSRQQQQQASSDAQTQSAESSFDMSAAGHTGMHSSGMSAGAPGPNVHVQVQQTSGTSSPINFPQQQQQQQQLQQQQQQQPQHQQQQQQQQVLLPTGHLQAALPQLLPSPIYGFGYDPTYCQYLGQAADGYQYELVRRPSIGLPTELLVPSNAANLMRRPSGGVSPVPPPMATQHHYLAPNSLQGSFDSAGGPPNTQIFIQQPLSPRHLHHHHQPPPNPHQPPPTYYSTGSIPPTQRVPGPCIPTQPDWGPSTNNADQQRQSECIPKLIHETSI
jgi:hypothetical protein